MYDVETTLKEVKQTISDGKGSVPICPKEKEDAIMDAFRYFNLIK